jgi:hypothetical protein
MTPSPSALLLDQVEVQLARFSDALNGKNPDELTLASAGLQSLVLTLSQSMRNAALRRADPTLSNVGSRQISCNAGGPTARVCCGVPSWLSVALATLIPSSPIRHLLGGRRRASCLRWFWSPKRRIQGGEPPDPSQCVRILARSLAIDWLCNWQIRDSVTSSTAAISFRFMSCS